MKHLVTIKTINGEHVSVTRKAEIARWFDRRCVDQVGNLIFHSKCLVAMGVGKACWTLILCILCN